MVHLLYKAPYLTPILVSKPQLFKEEMEGDNEWGLDAPAGSAMVVKILGSKGCCELAAYGRHRSSSPSYFDTQLWNSLTEIGREKTKQNKKTLILLFLKNLSYNFYFKR